ncbi:MAG TPA: M81 family metallopeptidase [Pseudolysinimonas sp.]|nr:M81 family metallopeptidase [Pseudolysinimonas sp.]
MRPPIAVAGMWQETNTYSSRPTTLEDYESFEVVAGRHLVEYHSGRRSVIGGFIAHLGDRVAPALSVAAWPAGLTPDDVFDKLMHRFEQELFTQRHAAGVLLNLHGAMAAQSHPDVEHEVVRLVRRVVGDVPIVAVLDFHANPSAAFLSHLDAVVSYQTYPHVDMFDRGVEAAQLIEAMVDSGKRWTITSRKLPLLTSPMSQGTDGTPVAEIMARRNEILTDGQVSAMPGFVYSDVARGGFTVTVSSPGRGASAPCDAMAEFVWDRRDEFHVASEPVRNGLIRALSRGKATVVADVGDNIGGGSPGDGTEVLSQLLELRATSALVVMCDARVARAASIAGAGVELDVELGGRLERLQGPPVVDRARVLSTSPGRYVAKGEWMGGTEFDMGPTAVLRFGGVDVIVTSVATPPFHREQITSQGLSPTDYSVVAAKGALAWQDGLADIADGAVFLDTKGSTPARPESLTRSLPPESGGTWTYPSG